MLKILSLFVHLNVPIELNTIDVINFAYLIINKLFN